MSTHIFRRLISPSGFVFTFIKLSWSFCGCWLVVRTIARLWILLSHGILTTDFVTVCSCVHPVLRTLISPSSFVSTFIKLSWNFFGCRLTARTSTSCGVCCRLGFEFFYRCLRGWAHIMMTVTLGSTALYSKRKKRLCILEEIHNVWMFSIVMQNHYCMTLRGLNVFHHGMKNWTWCSHIF